MASGIFMGLNTAMQGLMVSQTEIETASHNIDNANTPGYSRQRVDTTASNALTFWGLSTPGPGQIGTGVQVQDITRLSSQFLNGQYYDQNQAYGQAQVQQDTLNQITGIINEPSNTGISNALQQFWTAWDSLQSNPNELSARTQVQQAGVTLSQTLNQTANQLSSLNTNEKNTLDSRVKQANSILSQVASLTHEIRQQQETPGVNPNDLLDQRGQLLNQLSQLGAVSVKDTGSLYQVSLGNQVVVANGHAATLQAVDTPKPGVQATQYDAGSNSFSSTTPPTYADISSLGGQLQGTLDALSYVNSYQTDLNNIAQSLAGRAPDPTVSGDVGQGGMQVSLPGDWTLGPTSGTPTFPAPVTITDSSGTTTSYKKGDTVPSQYVTTASNGASTATIPAGTATVTVYGINGLQSIGYSQEGPGQAFFVSSKSGQPLDASNISVGVTPPQIAAGSAAQPGTQIAKTGDGTLAGAVSGVKNESTTFPNPADPTQSMTGTVSDYVQAVVSQLGIQSQTANNSVTNTQALVQQVDQQRQSVSGVSIDQEMANVIQYQQAYSASAKMISTINDMLTTLMQNV